jgi:LuxR family maltose regulon positive regulatory protein
LEQASLFIVPLDDHQRWYRYHALFADLLQMRLNQLEPALVTQLNLATYVWLRENGFPEKSIIHALAAGETEIAADIVEQCALKAIIDVDLTTVFEWFNRLPERIINFRPRLVVYSALANLMYGKADDLEDQLQTVEADLDATNKFHRRKRSG